MLTTEYLYVCTRVNPTCSGAVSPTPSVQRVPGLPGAPNGRPLGYGGRPHHSGELSRSAFDWCGDRTQTVDGSGRNDG